MVEPKDDSDFKAGEFKGRVEASLKTISGDIKEIKTEMKCINAKVANNRFKIAGIGATVSFVVTIVVLLVKELMGK